MGLLASNRIWFQKLDYLPVHLGLGAGLLSVSYAFLLGLDYSWWLFLSSAGAMFGIYAVNNYFDLEEDLVNKDHVTERLAHLSLYGGAVSIALSLGVAVLVKPLMVVPVVFLVLSVLAYSVKFLPPSFRYRRIKEVPFLKNLFVGAVWSLFCLWMPLALNGGFYAEGFFAILALNGVHYTVTTVIPDVRDVEGDRKAGVVTIPVKYGVEGARNFNLAITVLGTAVYIGAVTVGGIPGIGVLPALTSATSLLPIMATDRETAVEMTQIHEINFLFGFPLLLLAAAVIGL